MSLEVVTLGCRLNIAESERIAAMLAGCAETVVINSCAVTAEAARHTRRAIRRARKRRPEARLIVTGCAVGIVGEKLAAMPEIDALVENAEKLDFASYVRPRQSGDLSRLGATVGPRSPPSPGLAQVIHTRAFVPVQTGCDHDCTFCAIPRGRGASRSRPAAEIIAEIAALDAREVVLTGVDVTAWGIDFSGALRLGDLVEAILRACPSLERLRLSSLDGVEIDPALFELIASEPRIMPHLHLSLQSGDDMILKRMKRRHSRADAVRLVERLRARRSDIAIGADLIAGFPTETPEMHAANRTIVAELGVVHGHVFPYSPRPGTPAALMPQVAPQAIRERAAGLRQAVAEERRRWLASLIGRPQRVLAERDGTGHSETFAPVRLPAGAAPGEILTITPRALDEGILV